MSAYGRIERAMAYLAERAEDAVMTLPEYVAAYDALTPAQIREGLARQRERQGEGPDA